MVDVVAETDQSAGFAWSDATSITLVLELDLTSRVCLLCITCLPFTCDLGQTLHFIAAVFVCRVIVNKFLSMFM